MAKRTSGLTLATTVDITNRLLTARNPYLFGRGPRFRWAAVFGVLAAKNVSAVPVADNESALNRASLMETFWRLFPAGPLNVKTPQRHNSLRGFRLW